MSFRICSAADGPAGRRGAGVPPLIDWWPAYVLVIAGIALGARRRAHRTGTKIDEWSAAVAIGIVTSPVDLVLVLVITFYLLLDIRRLRSIVLRTLDPSHRRGARRVFSEIARVLGAYALFLALFAAMAEHIPMVGPVLGAVPALFVAATMPLPTVIWVGVAFVLIRLVESNILVLRLVGQAVGLHPVGSILDPALGFQPGGVIGHGAPPPGPASAGPRQSGSPLVDQP